MSSNANSNKNKRKSLTQNGTTTKKVKSLEIEDKSDESGDEFDSTIEDDDDTIEKKSHLKAISKKHRLFGNSLKNTHGKRFQNPLLKF